MTKYNTFQLTSPRAFANGCVLQLALGLTPMMPVHQDFSTEFPDTFARKDSSDILNTKTVNPMLNLTQTHSFSKAEKSLLTSIAIESARIIEGETSSPMEVDREEFRQLFSEMKGISVHSWESIPDSPPVEALGFSWNDDEYIAERAVKEFCEQCYGSIGNS